MNFRAPDEYFDNNVSSVMLEAQTTEIKGKFNKGGVQFITTYKIKNKK